MQCKVSKEKSKLLYETTALVISVTDILTVLQSFITLAVSHTML